MAEPISLGASIITIGLFSYQIIKVSKKIYHASKAATNLSEKIRLTAVLLESSGRAVESCYKTLRILQKRVGETRVLRNLERNGALRKLEEGVKLIGWRLQGLPDEIQSIESYFRFRSVMKWEGLKQGLEELTMHMECAKTTITMIMIVVQLEANILLTGKTRDPYILDWLQQERRGLKKTLRQQQKRAKSLSREGRQIQDTGDSGDNSVPPDSMPMLWSLHSLIRLSKRTMESNRWSNPPVTRRHTTSGEDSETPRPARPAAVHDSHREMRSASTSGGAPRATRCEPSYPSTTEIAGPSEREPWIVNVPSNNDRIAKGGYIANSKTAVPRLRSHVTGVFNPEVAVNLISIHKAQAMNLILVDISDGDPEGVRGPDVGEAHVIAKTSCMWWTSHVQGDPAKIDFYAVSHLSPEVILGAPFKSFVRERDTASEVAGDERG